MTSRIDKMPTPRELLKMSREERQRILEPIASAAQDIYANDPDLSEWAEVNE